MNDPTASTTVLVVDDEIPQMRMMCLALQGEGHSVTGCASATEALELLARQRFDLLFTDLAMPETDGIGLLRAALPRDPLMIGIVMTGSGTIATAVEAMKAGAFDYILKPFHLADVLPVVARALTVRRLRWENAELLQRVEERTIELERTNRELADANHLLTTANQDLEAFGYSVSHDLGAPVRLIGGFAKMLARRHGDDLPGDSKELLDYINSNAALMVQLIDGLLRLSGLGRKAIVRQPVDLDVLARAVAEEQLRACAGRDIDLRIGELGGCTGDPALLRQVFTNLLSNACKYTRETAHAVITVEAVQQDGERVYVITDNGMGFAMDQADRLFGVFKRLHNDERIEGTGIGLSIVQRVVHRCGGRIWAEAEVGKGACFRFTLAAPANTG